MSMRKLFILSLIFLLVGCGKKKAEEENLTDLTVPDSTTQIGVPVRTLLPPRPPEEILESLEPLTLPFSTESLPRNEDSGYAALQEAIATALHPETVKRMGLRVPDSTKLITVSPNMQLGETHYWFVGKLSEQKEYVTVLVGNHGYDAIYNLITFTRAGKIIDHLRLSEETDFEGKGHSIESVIDGEGKISVTWSNNYSEPYKYLGPESTTLYSIDNTGRFKEESTEQSYMETSVDWYAIPGAGLLSIEKGRGTDLLFSLEVGAGENCTGELSAVAVPVPDGKSFIYEEPGDPSTCVLIFTPGENKMTIEEKGDGCEHGFKCQFGGTYKKVASEKFSVFPQRLRFWLRQPVEKFACTLAKEYGYEDPKFKCGIKPSGKPDPRNESWNAGPVFPKDKVKGIHSLLSDLEIEWEHGDIRTLTFTFEKELSVQTVQRMFNLPRTQEDWETHFDDIQSINYGNLTVDQLRTKDLDLLFVKSLTLIGFEHMGAGDIEFEEEK
jgi:hypothetical protein